MPATVLVSKMLTLAEPPIAFPCCDVEFVPNTVSQEKLPPILMLEFVVVARTTMSLAQSKDAGAPPRPEADKFDDQQVALVPQTDVPAVCVSVAPLPTHA